MRWNLPRGLRIAFRIAMVNLFVIATLVPLAVIGVELWIRYSDPIEPAGTKVFVRDSELGWDATPATRHESSTAGGPAIAFIGDSFTHGKSWSGMTLADLHRRGFKFDGYSFGVGGFGTIQANLKLQRYFDEYHPSVVVLLFFAWNDVRDNFGHPAIYYSPETRSRPYYGDNGETQAPHVLPEWVTKSRLYERLIVVREQSSTNTEKHTQGRGWLAHADMAYYTDADTWTPFYMSDRASDRYVAGAWLSTERALIDLKQFLDARSSHLLVLGIDNAFTVDEDVYQQWAKDREGFDVTLPLRRLGEIAVRNQIDYVNCLPALKRLSAELGRKIYNGPNGNLSGHFEPEAEELIARLAADRIEAQRSISADH